MESPSLPSPFSRVLKHLRVFVAKYLSSSSGDGKVGDKGTERRMERERERDLLFYCSLLDMGKEERPDKYANALLFCCRIPAVGWEREIRRRRRRADRDKKLLSPLVQGRATGERVGLVLIFSLSFS